MLAPFGIQPRRQNVARVLFVARAALCWVFLWSMAGPPAHAQTEATWNGGAGTTSYDDPNNWDTLAVPVNNGGTTYNVTIPGSKTVEFDVDGVSEVTDLTLGGGSTLTIAPGEQLNVLDDARISGTISTTAGTFHASGVGAQFPGNSALLYASGGGQIAIAAAAYTNTRSDYRNHLTFVSAQGQDSLVDLSSAQSFSASGSWGRYGTFYYDVVASDYGVVDLSSVGAITGATDDDWLRFRVLTDGDVPLTALTQIGGRTQFVVEVDNYIFPALDTTSDTYFAIGAGRAVSAPELTEFSGSVGGINISDGGSFTAAKLTSISGSGGSLSVGAGATLSAAELLSIDGKALSIAAGGTFTAPKLASLTNSTLTLGASQTFAHGVIEDVNYSGLHVRDGRTLTLDGVGGYTNVLSDRRAHVTLLSAEGQDSLLDLSGAQSFDTGGTWGRYDQYYYDVVASDLGVVNLSSVGTIVGATDDDWLRFRISTGGNIPLTSLTQTSDRTQFAIDVDNYSFPALQTAADTHFAVGAGRAVNAPELMTLSGSAGGIAVSDGGSFTAAKLTSISGSGGSLSVGDGATLSAAELLSIDGKALSIAAGGTITAPELISLTRSTLTLGANQTFTHGAITDVDYSELHVRDGAALTLDAVGGYTNVLSDHRAHVKLLTAEGLDSLLDLSSAQSFDAGGTWGNHNLYYYDVEASDHGVVDLSSVGTIVGATNDDWLRFIVQTEGDIVLSSLTETSGRTQFVVEVDNYSLPALVTAANTHFAVGAGRDFSASELVTISGAASGLGVADGGSFTAAKLTSISGSGGSISVGDGATLSAAELLSIDGKALSIAAAGTITTPKLISLTNSTLTLGADQTFTHGLITDVDYSELHARDGATLALGSVGAYTNFMSDYRSHLTLLSARGQNSLLDLSSAQSISAAGFYGSYAVYYYDIAASDGGVIDLSSVGSITGAGQDDWLRFRIETEGDIPLPSLTQISARTQFVIDVDDYSFPALETAANTHFAIGAGRAVDAPELTTLSGSASGIGLSDGGSFTAPKLTTISGSGGSLTIGDGATLSAAELLSIDGKALSIAAGGTITAPELISLTNSTLTLGADQTFTHGLITDIDYSELHARDGATLALGSVGAYTNFMSDYRNHLTLLSAQGQNSLLDLSSAQSISAAGFYGSYAVYYYDIAASDGGVIDLSSVGSIAGAGQDDWLRFRVDTGGQIDLSSLRSITGRTMFDVNGDGVLKLGDVAITATTYFNINSPDTDVDVQGSLYLDGASKLTMVHGATMELEGDFFYAYTDESQLATTEAILHFDGSGVQFLEVGGENLGLGGPTAGNFGFGRLLVGQEGSPTTVLPVDLFDNGNRTGGGREALYLFGVGGLDGLELLGGSTLVLDGIDVYSWQDGEMVYLNDLFDPGVKKIAYAGGTIMIPEPSSLALLAAAAVALWFYRRFRRQ